jgi:two-component system response regulator YesN
MKILVVDDEPYVAPSLAPALRAGDRVESVTDGREAFDLLMQKPPQFDVAIVDHMMPGWAGAELIERLQRAGFPGKYLVLSGYLTLEIAALYRSIGVKHVIAKPINFGELRSALGEIEHSINAPGK